MQFYPHNIPTTTIGTAVSASFSKSGSYIANFATALIDTASLGLNITGSTGTAGTSATVVGPKGATGVRGLTGPRGNSVYLLSSSWHDESKPGAACPSGPENCWSVQLYAAYLIFSDYTCDFTSNPPYNPITYYTTDGASQVDVDLNFGANYPLYINDTCTDSVAATIGGYTSFPAVLGAKDGIAYTVNSLSTSSVGGVCSNPAF